MKFLLTKKDIERNLEMLSMTSEMLEVIKETIGTVENLVFTEPERPLAFWEAMNPLRKLVAKVERKN